MYFLLNLSHYVKSYGHLCQILAFFTMPALQIWPCLVTQESNLEKILFFTNFAFNIGKSCKISGRKALYFRSYQPKTPRGGGGGGKHHPSAFRVNKFAISTHTALKLSMDAMGNYLKLTCEYELHTLSNGKVGAGKDHGENYMKVRPPLARHL